MNQAQIHLALTHVPVILSLTGLTILIIGLLIKNTVVNRVALFIFISAGLFTLPVFFSGEGAEELVENLPGVSESIIERHEEFASFTLWAVIISALISAAALLKLNPAMKKGITYLVLISAVVTSFLMVQTAHLGGQVRHSEIRGGAMAVQEDGGEEEED